MRFTKEQYEQAIQSLKDASAQLEADGDCCACCGDSGHMAFECGHNPLVAMDLCRRVAAQAEALHESLRWLAGQVVRGGVQLGPAKVVVPTGGPQ